MIIKYIAIGLLAVLHHLTFAHEYNVAIGAKTNMSSAPVEGHPISYATDLDLNTYFQAEFSTERFSWVQFDLIFNINIKKLYLWPINVNRSPRIFAFVRMLNNVDYNPYDVTCYFDSPVSGQMCNCSINTIGRYVLIMNQYGYLLEFSEVAIITEDIDFIVARLGNANQSNADDTRPASNAIDGNINTCVSIAFKNVADSNKIGWWRVDMLQEYNINAVELSDINTEQRFRGFYSVYVSRSDPVNNKILEVDYNDLCIYFNQSTIHSIKWDFVFLNCSRPIKGRYLTIVKNSVGRPDALNFCEIIIHALNDFAKFQLPLNNSLSPTKPPTAQITFSPLNTNAANIPITTTKTMISTNIDANNKTGIIVGCVVGILAAIILAIASFLLYKKCRNRPLKRPRTPDIINRLSQAIRRRSDQVRGAPPVENSQVNFYDSVQQNSLVTALVKVKSKSTSEFKKLPNERVKTFAVGSSKQNWPKNRFKNIFPFDDNLVRLDIEEGDEPDDDYINASYIKGYGGVEKKYLAVQGPIPGTTRDMWRLVWKYKVTTIVMLTKLSEDTSKKSEQYWPSSVHDTLTLETISVSLVVEETYADYVCRQLLLKDTRFDEPARMVRQLHFLSWSDKKRPEECFPLLAFRKRVNRFNEGANAPLLVHCSAGVGRTGTYIAIDYLLESAREEQQVSVFQCVNNLRLQRMFMVQTESQYEFVYDAVIDGVKFSGCGISTNDYSERYQDIIDGNKIRNQLELLNSIRNFDRPSAGKSGKNSSKNRDKNIYAYDHCRPLLPAIYSNRSDYINASFVDSYREKRKKYRLRLCVDTMLCVHG